MSYNHTVILLPSCYFPNGVSKLPSIVGAQQVTPFFKKNGAATSKVYDVTQLPKTA